MSAGEQDVGDEQQAPFAWKSRGDRAVDLDVQIIAEAERMRLEPASDGDRLDHSRRVENRGGLADRPRG
jgi:hypothetical protein